MLNYLRVEVVLILLITLLFSACSVVGSSDSDRQEIRGTVTYVELEGGLWAIEEGEELYAPVDLPEEYQQEGLEVMVNARILNDRADIYQVGPMIEIISIEER